MHDREYSLRLALEQHDSYIINAVNCDFSTDTSVKVGFGLNVASVGSLLQRYVEIFLRHATSGNDIDVAKLCSAVAQLSQCVALNIRMGQNADVFLEQIDTIGSGSFSLTYFISYQHLVVILLLANGANPLERPAVAVVLQGLKTIIVAFNTDKVSPRMMSLLLSMQKAMPGVSSGAPALYIVWTALHSLVKRISDSNPAIEAECLSLAHNDLGRRGICCYRDGYIPFAFLKAVTAMQDSQIPSMEKELHQSFFCLFGARTVRCYIKNI